MADKEADMVDDNKKIDINMESNLVIELVTGVGYNWAPNFSTEA